MPPSSWLELGELGLQPPPTPVSHGIRTTLEGAILRYIQLSAQVDQGASATPGASGKEELRVGLLEAKAGRQKNTRMVKRDLRVSSGLSLRTKDTQG